MSPGIHATFHSILCLYLLYYFWGRTAPRCIYYKLRSVPSTPCNTNEKISGVVLSVVSCWKTELYSTQHHTMSYLDSQASPLLHLTRAAHISSIKVRHDYVRSGQIIF